MIVSLLTEKKGMNAFLWRINKSLMKHVCMSVRNFIGEYLQLSKGLQVF
jgi:hypothetical protein